MIAARSLASIPRQPGSARCAASIARRVSAAPMRGTSATTSPEAGLVDGEGRARVGVDPGAVDVPLAQDEVALQGAHDPSALLISAQVATFATLVIA